MRASLLAALALCFALPAFAQAPPGSVTINWTDPTQNVDGTAIPAGTVIDAWVYIGTAGPGSEVESAPVNATPITGTTYTTATTYAPGTVVCAVMKDGLVGVANSIVSPYSAEACTTIKAPTAEQPNPVNIITIKGN